MTRNIAGVALLALLLLAAPASALNGYLETFNDANDIGGSQPIGEPTAWYTTNTATAFAVQGGSYDSQCSITGHTICNGAVGNNLWTLATPVAGTNWNLNFTFTIIRKDSTQTPGSDFALVDSGANVHDAFQAGWTSATSFSEIHFGCTSPTTTTTVLTSDIAHSYAIHISFVAATNTYTINTGTRTCSFVDAAHGNVKQFEWFQSLGGAQGAGLCIPGTTRNCASYDNIVWNNGNGATYTAPATPAAVPGLNAFVKQAWTGSQSQVELRWRLSPTDPDPTTGTYDYFYYVNGVRNGPDAITSLDGNGGRYALLVFTGTAPVGLTTYWIVASDRGLDAPPSCTVAVDDQHQSETQSCGQATNTINGALNATSAGNALLSFAVSIGFSTTGDLFLFGLILVIIVMVLVFAILLAFAKNKAGTLPSGAMQAASVPSAITGVGVMVFNALIGFWEPWTGITLIAISAAAIGAFIAKIYGFDGKGG